MGGPAFVSGPLLATARLIAAHEEPPGPLVQAGLVRAVGLDATLILLAPASAAWLTAPGETTALVVTVGFAAAFGLAAVGVLLPATARSALIVAAAAAAVIWVAGEDFGGLLTGSATDPDSGPLLVLLALAFWPVGVTVDGPRALAARLRSRPPRPARRSP
jgi:hypothetical protein